MSIADKITRLQTAKTDIASAITSKGGTVSAGDGFEDFPSAISLIPSGGGSDITDRMASGFKIMVERQLNTYKEVFPYDNVRYGIIDAGMFDYYKNGEYRITTIGQRVFNSFSGNNYSAVLKMPRFLESITGANWNSSFIKYYDFTRYQRDTVPTTTATVHSGNSSKILVPKALEEEWKTATNWVNEASYIEGVEEVYD